MSWNSDSSANKLVRSYVKGFVDISGGNLVLRTGAIQFPDNSTLSTAPINTLPTDMSFANVDVSNNLKTAKLTFNDGTYMTTKYILPTDVSFSNVDVSNNLKTSTLTFNDGTYMTTKYVLPTDVSFANIDVSNNLKTAKLTFNDGTYMTTKYVLPTDISFSSASISNNLTVGGSETIAGNLTVGFNEYVGKDLFVTGNLSVTGQLYTDIIALKNRNITGTSVGFIPNTTQFAYSSIDAGVGVNDYITYGTQHFSATGDSGMQISSIDTTNKLITYTGGSTIPSTYDLSKNGLIIATNKIALVDSTGVTANMGITMNGVTINNAYVQSVDSSKNIILPTNSATIPTSTSLYGYIDANKNLVFKQDVSAGYYYTSAFLPTNSINYTTSNLSSRSLALSNNLGLPFTQSTSYALGVGAVYSSTELVCSLAPGGIGLANMFIDGGNVPKGAQIGTVSGRYCTVKDASATPFTVPSATATIDGYINGTLLTLDNLTGLSTYNIIKGTGTPAVTTANNYISGANTTNCTVTMGGAGTTASSTTVSGYIQLPGKLIVSPSSTVAAGTFLTGSGITGRCRVLSQSGGLVTTNYTAAMTPYTGVDICGAIISTSQFYYSGVNVPVVGRFVDCSNGTIITAVDASKSLVTVSPAIAQITPMFQKYGWISSASNLELFDVGGISTGSAVVGTGINDTKPIITLISGTTAILAGTTMTPTTSTTVAGYIKNQVGVGYSLVFKQDVSSNLFVSGTGLSGTALTTSSGKGVTFITAGTATATPSYYFNNYYAVSSTKISLVTTVPTNTYMLRDTNGVFQDGTYITDVSGYVCTITNQTITPTPSYATLSGAVVADPSGGYLLYYGSLIPNANTFAYNSSVFSDAGFAMGIQKLGRCAYGITYSGTPTLTTKALTNAVGFYYTNNTIIIPNTTANLSALNSITSGAMCEVGTDSTNNVAMFTGYYYNNKPPVYNGLWISVSYPAGSGQSLPAQSVYSSNTYGRPYNTSDYTKFYLGNINGGTPSAMGDFIVFNNTTQNLIGVRVLSVTPVISTSPPYVIVDLLVQMDTAVQVTNGTACYFYEQKQINIYNNLSLTLYDSSQCGLYAPVTFTVAQGSLYNVYTPRSVKMYTPGTYTVYTPSTYQFYATQSYYFYSDTSYNFLQYTPQQINLYNPQTVQYYRINSITVPQTTDTMCVLNYPQTMTNKTIVSPVLRGYPIFDCSQSVIQTYNSAGGLENFIWPRYYGDNGTYLNYGAGGFNLRDNSSLPKLQFNSAGNFYLPNATTVSYDYSLPLCINSGSQVNPQKIIYKTGSTTTPATGTATGTVTFGTAFPTGYTVVVTANAKTTSGDTNMIIVSIVAPSTTSFGYNVLFKDGRNGQTGGGWWLNGTFNWIAIGTA